jgi:hypothetical protein
MYPVQPALDAESGLVEPGYLAGGDLVAGMLQEPCGARLLDFVSAAGQVGDHRWVIFSVAYLLARCLLGSSS